MSITRLSEFLEALARFDVDAYARRANLLGRRQLAEDPALVTQVKMLAEGSERFGRWRGGSSDRRLCQLLEVAGSFFAAQAYLFSHEKPRYEPYASIPLLRYVLGVDGHQPLARTQRQIWFVFQELLTAQIEFETAALSSACEPQRVQFDPDVSRARVTALQELFALIPSRWALGMAPAAVEATRFEQIALEPTGASIVRRLLVFPQTPCHDEVAFLRSIQLAECLYWGTLLFVQRALCAVHLAERREALALLRAANGFAAPLVLVFRAVKIMPPAHFLGFRAATGDASAVQSRSWQLLDAHMYGVLAEKVPVLTGVPEVRQVLRLANPTFLPLVRVIERLGRSGADAELCAAISELDHKLRAWRKFHERQLAGRKNPAYLPEQGAGTGGTVGHAYLASHRPPRASQIAAARGARLEDSLDGTSS